jgi:hypothetical protein
MLALGLNTRYNIAAAGMELLRKQPSRNICCCCSAADAGYDDGLHSMLLSE